MDIITRKEARALGLDRYYTGKPCKHGHLSERRTGNSQCVQCAREYAAKYYDENKEDRLAYARKYNDENKDKKAEYNRQFHEANPEYYRQYHEANKDKKAEYNRQWREANKDKRAAHKAKRRAAKLNRTPPWADLSMIDVFYALAREMSEETGIPHHVDHIIPLQGENVSGLHVSINLQVIPATDNLSKGNSHTP